MDKSMSQKGSRRERGVLGGGWKGCVRRQAMRPGRPVQLAG